MTTSKPKGEKELTEEEIDEKNNNMIPTEIIELAIKGGWESDALCRYLPYGYSDIRVRSSYIAIQRVTKNGQVGRWLDYWKAENLVLDPSFWKCLGEALGWIRKEKYCPSCKIKKPYQTCRECHTYRYEMIETEELWPIHAHRFFDLILEGKDPTPFWKEILKK